MAVDEIHVGDIGSTFIVTVKDGTSAVDISGATSKRLILRRPDTTILDNAGTFTTNGFDGKLQYTTVADDLTLAGSWEIQAKVVITSGTFTSSSAKFTVFQNLSD